MRLAHASASNLPILPPWAGHTSCVDTIALGHNPRSSFPRIPQPRSGSTPKPRVAQHTLGQHTPVRRHPERAQFNRRRLRSGRTQAVRCTCVCSAVTLFCVSLCNVLVTLRREAVPKRLSQLRPFRHPGHCRGGVWSPLVGLGAEAGMPCQNALSFVVVTPCATGPRKVDDLSTEVADSCPRPPLSAKNPKQAQKRPFSRALRPSLMELSTATSLSAQRDN